MAIGGELESWMDPGCIMKGASSSGWGGLLQVDYFLSPVDYTYEQSWASTVLSSSPPSFSTVSKLSLCNTTIF